MLSEEAPLGEAIGAGGATGSVIAGVVQHVGGLAAGSTYHFRLVAVNAAGTSYGQDQMFTTLPEPVPGLTDGRAYELVTPADKQGGSDMFSEAGVNGYITNEQSTGTPSLDGSGFLLETRSAFGPFPGAFVSEYAFERHPPTGASGGGWSYVSLAAPGLGVQAIGETVTLGGSFGVFDPVDLSRFAFTDGVGAEVSEAGDRPTDLVGAPGGPYTTLHVDPAFTENEAQTHLETKVVGGSETVGVVVLESNDTGACSQPKGVGAKVEEGDVLCEWDGGYETPEGGGAPVPLLRLVSLAPGSESKPVSTCGAFLGAGTKPIQGGTRGAVSADGGVIVFTAPMVSSRAGEALTGAGCWNPVEEQKKGVAVHPPQVYASVREPQPSGEVRHETLRLSTPMEGVKEGGGTPREYPAQYIGASKDGSRVYFVSEAWLTADHPTVHDRELYECEITSETVAEHVTPKCTLTRISKGSPGSEAEHAGAMVDWAPVISRDGTVAYFSAFHALAEGATPQTPHSNILAGEVNVYRYDTTSGVTSYIAAVNTQDYVDEPTCADELGQESGPCTTEEWYTTPDGQYLLFDSSIPTDGYNSGPRTSCAEPLPYTESIGDGRCSELYRYDALAGEDGNPRLVCVSCGPGEADYEGNAQFDRSATKGPAAGPPAGMSDDGAFVFFDSQARLVSEVEDHTLHVYEWHETSGSHAQSIALISAPNDAFPSFFLGSSAYEYETANHEHHVVEGGNVFIGTHAKLVPQDTNTVGNIYDARICQPESPCIKPPPGETAQCLGNTCQTPPATPRDQTPASEVFSGAGNSSVLGGGSPKTPSATEVRAKKLAAALKKCRKDKRRGRRVVCERSARKRFGPVKRAKKTSRAKRAGVRGGVGR